MTTAVVLLVCTLAASAVAQSNPGTRYRVFGFSILPPLHSNESTNRSNVGWISVDLHVDTIRWDNSSSPSQGVAQRGSTLVNISVAVASPHAIDDGNSSQQFKTVVCNGEWVDVTRVYDPAPPASNVTILFPFMSNPSSCALRFIWPYCSGWANCDAGMQLTWVEREATDDPIVRQASVVGVELQQLSMTSSRRRPKSPPSRVSAFCGVSSTTLSGGIIEERHLRFDVMGSSNRWMSIANATSTSAGDGHRSGHNQPCHVRPYNMLRMLRELSFGPLAGLEPLSIVVDSSNGVATTWPLNYIDPPIIVGQLPPQPKCFSNTISWFVNVSHESMSVRLFQPLDDLMTLVVGSAHQSVQYVPMTPCMSEPVHEDENAAQPQWLPPYITSNKSYPSVKVTFTYCGGYGGTPSVEFTFRNMSKEPVDGENHNTIATVTLFGAIVVSSNGFTAPACPVVMSFNMSSSVAQTTSDATRVDDSSVLVDVLVEPAPQGGGGGSQLADCLEWNLANVGRTPWFQLQYHVINDRFWMATSFGAFPLSPCLQQ
jgi:hypothetical protein